MRSREGLGEQWSSADTSREVDQCQEVLTVAVLLLYASDGMSS